MVFLELTLADGRKLDVPPYAVLFVEGLDAKAREENAPAVTGLFYDVGGVQPQPGGGFRQGSLQTALVRDTFDFVHGGLAAAPGARVRLETPAGDPVLLDAARIITLEDLPGGEKCRVTHAIGDRMLPLDVKQTRDEIRAAMEGKTHGSDPQE